MAEPVLEPNWSPRRGSSPRRTRRRYFFLAAGVGIGTVVGLVAGLLIAIGTRSSQPPDPRAFLVGPFHAVQLSNGRLVVGRLDRLAAPFMVIADALTVEAQVDATTKEVTWSVPSRDASWHQPGIVIVGAQQVVSVDAVRPGSPLAAVLDEARKRR